MKPELRLNTTNYTSLGLELHPRPYFFDVDHFLKSLLNLLPYCFCFMFLVFWPRGMWDLSSPTRDRTHTSCIGRRSPNHCATKEVPGKLLKMTSN